MQLVLSALSIGDRLAQSDNVQAVGNRLEEGWVEWTPTWGLSLRFPDLEIRYRGRVTHGTGRPGVQAPGFFPSGRDFAVAGGGLLVAPSGPPSPPGGHTPTPPISLSLPLRGVRRAHDDTTPPP